MTPIIPSLSPLFDFLLPRNISGTDFGTGYGGTVCGFHTRPLKWWVIMVVFPVSMSRYLKGVHGFARSQNENF